MDRRLDARFETGTPTAGVTRSMIRVAVRSVYSTLDAIDSALLGHAVGRLTTLVELANLSAMLGNILAAAIVEASNGVFYRSGPHKYQDLRPAVDEAEAIEIKVALETNRPKGHLAKSGHYLVARYVLGDEDGKHTRGTRGNVVWIWEIRLGQIHEKHFSLSSTPGDSGKTAVVTMDGIRRLEVLYFDPRFSPYAHNDRYLHKYSPTIDPTMLER